MFVTYPGCADLSTFVLFLLLDIFPTFVLLLNNFPNISSCTLSIITKLMIYSVIICLQYPIILCSYWLSNSWIHEIMYWLLMKYKFWSFNDIRFVFNTDLKLQWDRPWKCSNKKFIKSKWWDTAIFTHTHTRTYTHSTHTHTHTHIYNTHTHAHTYTHTCYILRNCYNPPVVESFDIAFIKLLFSFNFCCYLY